MSHREVMKMILIMWKIRSVILQKNMKIINIKILYERTVFGMIRNKMFLLIFMIRQ